MTVGNKIGKESLKRRGFRNQILNFIVNNSLLFVVTKNDVIVLVTSCIRCGEWKEVRFHLFGYLVISTSFSLCSCHTFVKILYAVVNLILKTSLCHHLTLSWGIGMNLHGLFNGTGGKAKLCSENGQFRLQIGNTEVWGQEGSP